MMEGRIMEENLERLEELRDCLEKRYNCFIDEFGCVVVERKNSLEEEEEKEILMAKELEKIYGIEKKEILKVLKKIREQGWNVSEIFLWLKENKENFIKLKEMLSVLEDLEAEEKKEEEIFLVVDPRKLAGFPYVLAKALSSISPSDKGNEEDENLNEISNEIKENSFKLVSRIPIKVVIKEEIETVLKCMIQDMIFNSEGGEIKEYVKDLSLLTMEDEERILSFIEKLEDLLKNRLRGLFRRIEKLEEFNRKLQKRKISFKRIKEIEKELVIFGKKVYSLGIILRNKLKKLGTQSSKGIYKEIYFLIRKIIDEYFERFWILFKRIKKKILSLKKEFYQKRKRTKKNKKKLNK